MTLADTVRAGRADGAALRLEHDVAGIAARAIVVAGGDSRPAAAITPRPEVRSPR